MDKTTFRKQMPDGYLMKGSKEQGIANIGTCRITDSHWDISRLADTRHQTGKGQGGIIRLWGILNDG